MSTNDHRVLNIKPNEDHDGGNDEKQKEADQKASKDMNLERKSYFYIKMNLENDFKESIKTGKLYEPGKTSHRKRKIDIFRSKWP